MRIYVTLLGKGHIAHREDKRKAYKILVGKSDETAQWTWAKMV